MQNEAVTTRHQEEHAICDRAPLQTGAFLALKVTCSLTCLRNTQAIINTLLFDKQI